MACTLRLLASLAGAAALLGAVHARTYRVTLAPSNVDRAVQVVTFPFPADAGKSASLEQADGAVFPLQVEQGKATFVVPRQKAGETLTFTLREGSEFAQGVETRRERGHLRISVGGKPVLVYRMDKDDVPRPDIAPEYKRAGYLHPIYSPTGVVVSDDYPVQHVHQHGIWSPWTKTSFQGREPDFWNMGKKTGTVEFVALDRTWHGAVHGGFAARHRFVDLSAPSPVVALHETWLVTAYNTARTGDVSASPSDRATVFDLMLTQTCATNDPLILPKFHYGGLGFRGRGEWLGKENANFLTSEGETDRVKANAQKMRWVHLWGNLAGGSAGLTILGHPENFRAPQPVRVHPNEPYVSITPSQEGDWRIEPGKPYVARYRFVAIDGPPDRSRIDALWNGYATAAMVKLQPVGAP